MSPLSAVERTGDFLFRRRSYLPLALLPLIVVAVTWFQHPMRTRLGDLLWEIVCVLVALSGLAIRVVTVGFAAPGTSGRNTREQKARSLNTTGAYSLVRHPLYLANGVIALGLALFPHTWMAPPVVALLTFAYYACIVQREETFLRERFGRAFETWAARVPALVPSRRTWVPPDRAFDWRVVLSREFYALSLILVLPLGLDLVEDLLETGEVDVDALWSVVAIVGLALFVGLRFVKKRTTWLRRPPAGAIR